MKKTLTALTLAAALGGMIYPVCAAPKHKKTAKTAQAAPPATETASDPAVSSAPAAPLPEPEIAATAYAVKDLQSGQVILGQDLDKQIEPASLTKLMTAYLTFKALEEGRLKPDQMLTVSAKAWKTEGSRMFLENGKTVSVSDLIKGVIVQSANDASVTLAEAIGGSEEQFARMMNEEAKRLGMTNTNFQNSTGLTAPKHLTTVNDLLTLSGAIIRDYPQYYPIYSIRSFTYNNITQANRNLLLYRDPNVDGLKTGHTNSAGYNLIASSKRDGRRVLSVVVGASSPEARATESSKLLNYALQSFETAKMYQAGQEITKVKVYKGAVGEVPIGFDADTYVTVPYGKTKTLENRLETRQPVIAPIAKGQEMGTVKLMDGDKVVAEKKLVALQAVSEAGFFGRLWDSIVLWFKSLFAD